MAGVHIRTVQQLLGPKTIAMTARYAHLAPKHTLAAVERLDAHTQRETDRSFSAATGSSCHIAVRLFDKIGLQTRCPGGGMAYAGDLKSPDAHASCGFDPHPGHNSNNQELTIPAGASPPPGRPATPAAEGN
jgi:hypothetical protein